MPSVTLFYVNYGFMPRKEVIYMSKFNVYAQKVNDIAKENFSAFRSAETNYHLAEEDFQNHPEGMGGSPEFQAKAVRVKAKFIEEQGKYKEARATLERSLDDVYKIQKELEKDVNNTFGADPSAVDLPTMELIKSGVLTAADYERLIEKAMKDNNITMLKILGKNAEELSNKLSSLDDIGAAKLRSLANAAQKVNGSAYVSAFELLVDCYRRCVNNTYMINHWDELTKRAIESF